VAWEYYKDPTRYIRDLQEQGFKVFVLEQTPESIDFHRIGSMEHENICLILGNEIDGVRKEFRDIADYCVEIPMLGQKQSLNVATAGGICMYQFLRS